MRFHPPFSLTGASHTTPTRRVRCSRLSSSRSGIGEALGQWSPSLPSWGLDGVVEVRVLHEDEGTSVRARKANPSAGQEQSLIGMLLLIG